MVNTCVKQLYNKNMELRREDDRIDTIASWKMHDKYDKKMTNKKMKYFYNVTNIHVEINPRKNKEKECK
jgi:hypothetical protein